MESSLPGSRGQSVVFIEAYKAIKYQINLSYFFWSPDEDVMIENMLCFYCFFKWLSTKAF